MPTFKTLGKMALMQMAIALALIGGAECLVQASRPTAPAAGKVSRGGPAQAPAIAPVATLGTPISLK